jgi:hypothetical protein
VIVTLILGNYPSQVGLTAAILMTRGALVILLRSGVPERKEPWFFLLLLSRVLCPALVDDEAVDGVGGGVAEELDLRVDDFEVELCFGFGEEVEFRLLRERRGEVPVFDRDDVVDGGVGHVAGPDVLAEEGRQDGDRLALGVESDGLTDGDLTDGGGDLVRSAAVEVAEDDDGESWRMGFLTQGDA